MIRHVNFCGSFFDAGVKKLDTAFSDDYQLGTLRAGSNHLLVVVDSTLRFFKGGGDKDACLAPAFVLRLEFAFMILSDCAEVKRRGATVDIGGKSQRLFLRLSMLSLS